MQINITGHHVEVTKALKDFIHDKFQRLERYYEFINSAHVILTVEKLSQKAEALLTINGGEIFADSTTEDMYSSIDSLIDKLDRQLQKHKEKVTAH